MKPYKPHKGQGKKQFLKYQVRTEGKRLVGETNYFDVANCIASCGKKRYIWEFELTLLKYVEIAYIENGVYK